MVLILLLVVGLIGWVLMVVAGEFVVDVGVTVVSRFGVLVVMFEMSISSIGKMSLVNGFFVDLFLLWVIEMLKTTR